MISFPGTFAFRESTWKPFREPLLSGKAPRHYLSGRRHDISFPGTFAFRKGSREGFRVLSRKAKVPGKLIIIIIIIIYLLFIYQLLLLLRIYLLYQLPIIIIDACDWTPHDASMQAM